MKLLAFAASNSTNSINRSLVEFASHRLIQVQTQILGGIEVDTLNIDDFEMPIYSGRRETESGVPQLALDLLARMNAADAIMISFPEHNGNVPAAWKNIFDWISRKEREMFGGKPVMILSASPGGRAGAGVLGGLEPTLPHFGAQVSSVVGIGNWHQAFANGTLTNDEDLARLDASLSAFASACAAAAAAD